MAEIRLLNIFPETVEFRLFSDVFDGRSVDVQVVVPAHVADAPQAMVEAAQHRLAATLSELSKKLDEGPRASWV